MSKLHTFSNCFHTISIQMKLFNALQSEKGTVHQILDLIALKLEDFQACQTLKTQAGNLLKFVLVHFQNLEGKTSLLNFHKIKNAIEVS